MLGQKWELVLLNVTVFAGAIFLYSIFQVSEYSSAARIMIIQKSLQDADAFIAARSSERLSIILSEVIYSNSFFNDVLASSKNIIDDFSQDPAERRKQWQGQVKNRINSDKGIIEITVFDKSRDQSAEILNGIIKTLTDNGEKYHGGSNISIRVIDEPLVSKEPVRPDTVFDTVTAGVLAFIGTSVFIYLFAKPRQIFSIAPIRGFQGDDLPINEMGVSQEWKDRIDL